MSASFTIGWFVSHTGMGGKLVMNFIDCLLRPFSTFDPSTCPYYIRAVLSNRIMIAFGYRRTSTTSSYTHPTLDCDANEFM